MKVQPIKNYKTGTKEFKAGDSAYYVDEGHGKTLIDAGLAKKVEPELASRKKKIEVPDKTK